MINFTPLVDSSRNKKPLIGAQIVLLVLSSAMLLAHAPKALATAYVSTNTGAWATTTTWTPNGVPGASDTARITNGITVNTGTTASSAGVTVESGGTLSLGSKLTVTGTSSITGLVTCASSSLGGTGAINVESGGRLRFTAAALSSYTGVLTIKSGGTYENAQNQGTVPTATWNAGSTNLIDGQTSATSGPGGMGQAFANIVWNCPSATTTSQMGLGAAAGFKVTEGFYVISTGTGICRQNSTADASLPFGDIKVSGGTFQSTGTGSANMTNNISGNVTVSGGIFDLRAASGTSTFNVTNDYAVTGGSNYCSTSSGNAVVNFAKSGVQTFTGGGVISPQGGVVTWVVTSASTVKAATALTLPASNNINANFVINGVFDLNGQNVSFDRLTNDVIGVGVVTNGGTAASAFTVGASGGSSVFSGTIKDGPNPLSLSKAGAGALMLVGANTYAGDTSIAQGSLTITNIGNIGVSGNMGQGTFINLGSTAGNGTLIYTGPGETTTKIPRLSSSSGTGTLDQSGTGLLKFTGYSASGGGSTTHTLTLQGSTVGAGEMSGVISNGPAFTVNLQKSGSGTWTLSGNNTYSGTTTIGVNGTGTRIGVLRAAANQALGSGTVTIGPGGNDATARLELSGGVSLNNLISLSQRNNTTAAIENISGNNALSGTIALSSGGSDARVQSDAGTLTLGTAASAAVSNTVAASTRIITLQGAGNGAVAGNVVNGTGTIALTKTDAGTWTLSGVNTYSGDTTISNGTLALSGSGSIASTPTINVTSGATFDVSAISFTLGAAQTLKGNGTVNGAVTASGTIAPGASIGTLTLNNSPTLSGTLFMEINTTNSPATNDLLVVSGNPLAYGGTLTVTNTGNNLVGGEVFDLFDATSFSGAFSATNLPTLSGSLNWYLGDLTVNGKIYVNRPPTANNKSYPRSAGASVLILKSDLLSGAGDSDSGDSVSFDTLTSAGSQGATVSESASAFLYEPANNNNDTLTFRVKDNRGGTVTKNISITVDGSGSGGTAQTITPTSNGMVVSFAGIPGFKYDVERADDVSFTVNLTTLATTNAPGNGLFSITDATPPTPTAYYRLKYNPN